MQGIAALVNGSFVAPELLDGLIDDAATQFLQGNRPDPDPADTSG
ncbi:hypothetical protein [Nocardia neocaledoniensis]|nr:hypothetical protein [Nocardia neocaledoniensis]